MLLKKKVFCCARMVYAVLIVSNFLADLKGSTITIQLSLTTTYISLATGPKRNSNKEAKFF